MISLSKVISVLSTPYHNGITLSSIINVQIYFFFINDIGHLPALLWPMISHT